MVHPRRPTAAKRLAVTAIAAATIVTLAACSSGNAESTREGKARLAPLTVAEPVPVADFAVTVVAKEAGLFKKYGLDVTVKPNAGSNIINELASGQIDLADYTPASAMIYAAKGRPASAIWAREIINPSGIFTGPDITSLSQIRNTPNCRFATTYPGSSQYGDAVTYLKELNLGNCQLVPTKNQTAQVNGVLSGAYTAGDAIMEVLLKAKKGGGHILINPTTAQFTRKHMNDFYLSGVFWGTKATLNKKRKSIIAFLRALHASNNLIARSSPAKITTLLRKNAAFATTPTASLEELVKGVLPKLGDNVTPNRPGYISKQIWDQALKHIATWGIQGYNPKDPAIQYGKLVDMSYFRDAAAKDPTWKFSEKPASAPLCWLSILGCNP